MNIYYVYMLIDSDRNEPFYVGKGKNRRIYQHILDAKHSNKKSPIIDRIRSIQRNGKEVNCIKIIDNISESVAFSIEQFYIRKIGRVNLNTGSLLNRTAGGEGTTTLDPKILEAKRIKSSKPVDQYTLAGEFIQAWTSAKEAALNVTSANRSYITQVCKRKRRSSGGFIWCYSNEKPPIFFKKYYHSVHQYDIKLNLIRTFSSVTNAALFMGVDVRSISSACSGRTKTSCGYVWVYNEKV